MKFVMRLSILLALLMTACSSVAPEIDLPAEAAVVLQLPTDTPQQLPTVTPAPISMPGTPANGIASYRGLRFQYNLSLASFVRGEIFPASQGSTPEFDMPEHVRFLFDEIRVSSTLNAREPQLLIFPTEDFKRMSSKRFGESLDNLTQLLIEKPANLAQELTLLPAPSGKPVLQVQAKYLKFEHGEGIRFLSSYAEEIGPVTNSSLFYTFQGISADGAYYVSMFYPIETPMLPAEFEDTTAASDYWLFVENYDEYLTSTIDQLEGLSAQSFTPSLALLDDLITSLELPDKNNELRQTSDPEQLTDRIRREGKIGLRTLWRDFEIVSTLFEDPGELNLELFNMDINGNQDEYRLLLISDTNELDWQYLLFRSAGSRWLFVGSVELSGQKYLPPACRIVERGGKAWWVLTWLDHTAPGVTHYRETWYTFNAGPLRSVWSFPLEGYQVSPDYVYNVLYLGNLEAEDNEEEISFRLTYTITYSILGDGEEKSTAGEIYNLFDLQRSVVYQWDDQALQFTLEPEYSQLTQEQIDAVFYFPGPDHAFLRFAAEELLNIAQNGTVLQKRWLEKYLESLEQGLDIEEFKIQIGG
jgi:hypothetical protein